MSIAKAKRRRSASCGIAGRAAKVLLACALVLGLAPNLGLQQAQAASTTVNLTTGSQNHYAGGVTRSIYVDGEVAYCMDPANATPAPGTYTTTDNLKPNNPANVQTLKAALWFAYGSPGFDKSMWPSAWYDGSAMTDSNYYCLAHILLSQLWESSEQHALSGTSQAFRDWAYENVLGWKSGEFLYPDSTRGKVKDRENEVPSSFHVFVIEPTRSGDQNVLSFSYEPKGTFELTKVSANPGLSDGNSCYSLEGAVYGVYSDAACTKFVESITTNTGGFATVQVDAGKYWVKEITAPHGYGLDEDVYEINVAAGETSKLEVQDTPQNDPVNILLGKFDGDRAYNGAANIAQAGAPSVEGAEFTFRYYDGQYSTAAEATASGAPTRTWVFKTDANGFINPQDSAYTVSGDDFYKSTDGRIAFPLGTYLIQETKAPTGYTLDSTIFIRNITPESGTTENITTYNTPEVPDGIIRGGVEVVKIDSETGGAALGAATVEGTQFAIRNMNDQDACANGVWYAKGQIVATIAADASGVAKTTSDLLPYGTYSIEETAPGTGMVFGGEQAQTFSITEEGQMVKASTDGSEIKFENSTIRGDLSLVKVRESDQKRLSFIPFKITSNTTGESHILVTDENGEAKTSNAFNPHNVKTNANDAAVDAEGNVDVAKLEPYAGIWFGQKADGSMTTPDNRGALPYDSYTVEELSVPNNKGLELVKFDDVRVIRDNYELSLGTIDDQPGKSIWIGTTALDSKTLTHTTAASTETSITDTVSMTGLAVGTDYVLKASLVDKATSEPITVDGVVVTAEKAFTATGESGTQTVQLVFDALDVNAERVVVFEELYVAGGTNPVSEHKDPSDAGQTVIIVQPKIGTTATGETGKHTTSIDPVTTLTDTVAYTNLVPGAVYTLTSELVDAEGNPILDEAGNAIGATTEFTPAAANGSVNITVVVDTSKMDDGTKLVFFETVSLGSRVVAEHKDPSDGDQTVTVEKPEIGTELTEGGDHEVVATESVMLTDTVAYKGLVTDGRSYTVKGTLMAKPKASDAEPTPYVDADGNAVTADVTFVPATADGTVDVTFEFNGVNLAAGDELVAFEELSRERIVLSVHADIEDKSQTVTIAVPIISTQVGTETIAADDQATIDDKVSYENLAAGKNHRLIGIIVDKATGMPLLTGAEPADQAELASFWRDLKAALKSGEAYPAAYDQAAVDQVLTAHPAIAERIVMTTKDFQPASANGSVDVQFSFDASAWTKDMAKSCVVFEYLYTDKAIASHENPNDKGQSFTIMPIGIGTTAVDATDKDHTIAESKSAQITDTVAYTNLVPGKQYTVKGKLMDKASGKPVMVNDREVTAETQFTPNAANGTVEVQFTFDSTGMDGKDIVVFEYLYKGGVSDSVADHTDINDKNQTVHVDKLGVPWGRAYSKTGDVLRTLAPLALVAMLGAAGIYQASRRREEEGESPFQVAGTID